MAHSNRAPKQWQLTTNETLNSFTNWKENLCYTLSLDAAFKPLLRDGVTWQKQTAATPTRGFTDDPETVTTNRQTKEEKVATLNLMLGQIANYATVISRNQLIKNSVSLTDIWDKIRQHYGFHTTGSRFLDLANVRLQPAERPEDLYQRLVSFIDDNLLTTDSTVTHHLERITRDEEVSPSLENVVVLLWLERLHVGLPALVKQRYGAELRNKTLASIKPEISQALSSLLEELSANEDSRVLRLQSSQRPNNRKSQPKSVLRGGKYCCLCRTANRDGYEDHYLTQCPYLPKKDKEYMARVRILEVDDNDDDGSDDSQHDQGQDQRGDSDNSFIDPPPAVLRRVTTRKSPRMQCFYGHIPITLCLDSGAESNMISQRECTRMGLRPSRTNQGATQADRTTALDVIGEISEVNVKKGSHTFKLDALVIRDDIGDIIAGEPFLERNDIGIRPAKRQIIIQGREIISFASL